VVAGWLGSSLEMYLIPKYSLVIYSIPESLHGWPKRKKILLGELLCDPQPFREGNLGSCQLHLLDLPGKVLFCVFFAQQYMLSVGCNLPQDSHKLAELLQAPGSKQLGIDPRTHHP
jgi:hypothetical protein